MKVSLILTLAVTSLLIITGCKSKREKIGDGHLEQGNYKVAVQMYLNAEEKGEVSEDFPANLSLALTGLMEEIALRDPLSNAISNYTDEIPKYLSKVKDPTIIGKYGVTIAKITKLRVKEGQFIPVLQGFQAITKAKGLLEALNATHSEFTNIVEEAEKLYTDGVIKTAKSESDYVRAEYFLLEAETVLPANTDIKEVLNRVRLKNRSNFLIFSEDVNGITPSPLVDRNAFVMAFPRLTVGSKSASGELQLWNTSGNNQSFKASDFKLISTEGKSVPGKRVRGSCEKVNNENDCAVVIKWRYENGFTPDYVLAKKDNAEGRKYLGVK
ncbi:MAG: hypothetical protein OCD01_18290 [Fibrobacterales bacterium]